MNEQRPQPKKKRPASLASWTRSALWLPVGAALVATLIVLAFLQYHWIGQVSAADRERMEAALNTSVIAFVQDFRRELQRPAAAFRPEPAAASERLSEHFAERFSDWRRTAENEGISAVWVIEFEVAETRAFELDGGATRRTERAVPEQLQPVVRDLEQNRTAPQRGRRGWTVYGQVPAMAHMIIRFLPNERIDVPPEVKTVGAIVLVLDPAYVRERLIPELVRKHFGAGAFDVAILDRSGAGQVLYSSSHALGIGSRADARVRLLGPVPPGLAEIARRPAVRAGETERRAGPGTFLSAPDGEGPWELIARHRRGSLDDVVSTLRRRNLVISFGILLLLATGMAMIIVSTQRAQRLARLQLDFVAGVSHEFRTPVAVICSAGDNLADGIVDPNPRVKQYGGLVRDQGHRLRDMVEQILSFAAGQGERKYDLRPVDAAALIDGTLSDCRPLIEQSKAAVKRDIQPDLPQVIADEAALKQCLQNLVINGLKYGGDYPLLVITARARHGEVRITVADKGIGIEPDDLPHIFEPFYRGRAAVAAQIHGTGLGLSLARDLVEGMGGRIQVSSVPGKGSSFTLLLKAVRTDGVRA